MGWSIYYKGLLITIIANLLLLLKIFNFANSGKNAAKYFKYQIGHKIKVILD